MSTHHKNSPHHPRPKGTDATKKDFKVEDATGKVFGDNLTWDDAWKLKEQVAGARKSTTPRIKKMDGSSPPVQTSKKTWSDAQRQEAAVRAARSASHMAAQMEPPCDLSPEQIASGAAIMAALDANPELAALIARQKGGTVDETPDEESLLESVLGSNGSAGDDDIDALIDEAQDAPVSEH